jgi:hypothetical protein
MNASRLLKVGVAVPSGDADETVARMRTHQHGRFVAMLLTLAPAIEAVWLICDGAGEACEEFAVPLLDLTTAWASLDVVIELSGQLPPAWIRAFQARGGRVVGLASVAGCMVEADGAAPRFPNGLLASGASYDAIWTPRGLEYSCRRYFETELRVPVTVIPEIWSPEWFEHASRMTGEDGAFHYRPGRGHWRLAILAPSGRSVETPCASMLVADIAHRQDPHFIDSLHIYGAQSLGETFRTAGFAGNLDLNRHGILTFESCQPVDEILTCHADAVVSNQRAGVQDYAYYEILYGGYPLVHCSDLLGSCGYRYLESDCEDGALALRRAFAEHDLELDGYLASVRDLLAELDPAAQPNVDAYDAAIEGLQHGVRGSCH